MRPLVLMSSLQMGGAERNTVSILRRLQSSGAGAALCTVSSREDQGLARELGEAGVLRIDLGARRLADPRALARYLRLLSRGGFDLVHAHGQDAGILAAAARPFTRKPYLLTRHVLEEPERGFRQRLRVRSSLAAARCASARIAVSRAAAKHLSRAARIPEEKIDVIPNGIEVERFDADALRDDREKIRQRLGVREDEPLLLLPAVLREGKGHEVALEALPFLRAQVPRARLAFAGGGEREACLRRRAEPFGDAVLFLGWREDVPALLAASDVVLLPSFQEAYPTVLLEAAAAARPVVATRLEGIQEIVEDGGTGWLVPTGDPSALAEAAAALLRRPERARALGESARRRAWREFSLDRQVERTLDLWSRLLRRERR